MCTGIVIGYCSYKLFNYSRYFQHLQLGNLDIERSLYILSQNKYNLEKIDSNFINNIPSISTGSHHLVTTIVSVRPTIGYLLSKKRLQ